MAHPLASSGRTESVGVEEAPVVVASPPLPFTTPSHDASSLRNDTSRKRPLAGGGSSGSEVAALMEQKEKEGRKKERKS